MMTEPVRTRSEVEQELRDLFVGQESGPTATAWLLLANRVSAALLAMAECEHLSALISETDGATCLDCAGTGYEQSRLARGLNALEGR